ncbi:hypothetical protein NPIL_119171 [Nephila pilipes]|uniref:Uncharacterized protein n=1 Tax=Nephila pilipes TaxID=299642 RepID=A0A8X6PIE2_NEPPI|nr:hypothetical protein NPIL_119171 [Nephila pilipes]
MIEDDGMYPQLPFTRTSAVGSHSCWEFRSSIVNRYSFNDLAEFLVAFSTPEKTVAKQHKCMKNEPTIGAFRIIKHLHIITDSSTKMNHLIGKNHDKVRR